MGGVSMEWKEVTLGDLCEISSSKRIFAKEYQSDGVPFYRGKEIIAKQKGNAISNELFISRNRYEEIKARYGVPQQRELLLTSVGTLGVPYVIKEEEFYFKDGNLTWFRHFNGLDVEYLYYWFLSPYGKNEINTKAIGSTQKALTIDSLSKFDIKIPANLDDQRRIASILSSLDRKIELNNKINADLEEMAQAIFKNWFVDFEPFKDGKFVDSELGMIPEGWKVGRLTDVIKLMPGGTPKTSETLYWDNGTIPFFSPKDVNGVYCFATEKHITEAGLNKCSSNLYPKDTIFITCRGTVGKVCLAACDMAMNQSNYAIKAIDGYSQYYIFFLVKSVVERLIKKSNGAVFSAITSKDFDEEILIPSQKAVEDFANVIDGFFRRIFTIGTENSRLSTLRDTLLPRLMSGELEVPE